MLNLDHHITINEDTINSSNLASQFYNKDLQAIGNMVWEGYISDKSSRSLWEKRTQSAMDLALQIQKEKNFPWPNCSNVAFPLITIAVMQFHSRAYPALISGTDIVKCRVIGEDQSGEQKQRAERISRHMSYQVLEEDDTWEAQHDRLLINYATVGTAFVKSFHSASKGHNVTELVLAKDLVVNYWAKSIEDCPRKTHTFPLFRNEVHERVLRGTFCDVLEESWYQQPTMPIESSNLAKEDKRMGMHQPQADDATPFIMLEQHCSLDLDGDGYAEPYIVTIEATSRQVCRIVTRFESEQAVERVKDGSRKGQIIRVIPIEYFTKWGLIPSPDGGIYDIGFGVLAGPLNEAVNSLTNQLIDSGTMANSGGGFLGRGAKFRGGVYTIAPFEWKRVDSTGDDLHKSIVQLPVREPSAVLLNLLSLLIDYTNRIMGSTEMMVGENPGQNTPAQTSQAMIEQGSKIYSALFKRAWRSMREEFKKLYILNGIYMPNKVMFGDGTYAMREDYLGDPNAIAPVADPHVVSEQQKLMQVQTLKQAAMSTPGYSLPEVEKRFLKAIHIEGIEQVYPGPDKVPPLPNPKMAVENIKLQAKQQALELDKMKFITGLQEEQRVNSAKIIELHAKAAKEMAEADGVQSGHMIAMLEAQIGAMRVRNEHISNTIGHMMKGMEHEQQQRDAVGGGVSGMAGASGDQGSQGGDGQSSTTGA